MHLSGSDSLFPTSNSFSGNPPVCLLPDSGPPLPAPPRSSPEAKKKKGFSPFLYATYLTHVDF